jgi:hypothetical protein
MLQGLGSNIALARVLQRGGERVSIPVRARVRLFAIRVRVQPV